MNYKLIMNYTSLCLWKYIQSNWSAMSRSKEELIDSSAIDEKTRLRVVQIGGFISTLSYHRQCTCMPVCTHPPSGKMPPSGSGRRMQGLKMILF